MALTMQLGRKFGSGLVFLALAAAAHAEDWPEWRGKGRAGVWTETGILEKFPDSGLKVRWRTPVRTGFAGPAVAAGRVYVTDFSPVRNTKGIERVQCLDEKTGAVLWTRDWESDYIGLMQTYAVGPRATPTVDGDRVFVVGAKGALLCLDARTGQVLWQKDYVRDYRTDVPTWGMTGAPIVDGERVIALVGGRPDALVIAFDKKSGKELWRALPSEEGEPGYCQMILTGRRQLIVWQPRAVVALEPSTGKVLWQEPFKIQAGLTVATPVESGGRLLVSSFYNGSLMLDLAGGKRLWKGSSDSEIKTDGLHSLISTPAIDGEYIYGICSYGQFRCLNARTGERVWETLEVTREKARWSTGFIVRQGDRYFINNDHGELIIARLSPRGYQEISRTKLIEPTSNPGNRRELGAVHWSHPAYANRHIVARNDREILSAALGE
ncbi:MAG: PQQ-like beta-propeller repeat protein [Acidobacteria bacterium]|nr:PQQ-like beta-propeller repeat protein [Acidobacteriota bacterium]